MLHFCTSWWLLHLVATLCCCTPPYPAVAILLTHPIVAPSILSHLLHPTRSVVSYPICCNWPTYLPVATSTLYPISVCCTPSCVLHHPIPSVSVAPNLTLLHPNSLMLHSNSLMLHQLPLCCTLIIIAHYSIIQDISITSIYSYQHSIQKISIRDNLWIPRLDRGGCKRSRIWVHSH